MIGSLLLYVLYPFSRYLSSRSSEASKNNLPPAALHGPAVWDGGGDTTNKFSQSETTPLDLWLSPTSDSKGETKERVKESNPEKEDDTKPDMDNKPLMAVRHYTKNDAALEMCEVQSEVQKMKTEKRHGPQQEKVEAPRKQDGEKAIHHNVLQRKQDSENGNIFSTEDINPEQKLGEQTKCLQTEDIIQEITCPLQEQTQTQTSEESVTIADISPQETTCSANEQVKKPNMEKSQTPAEVTECWDEYVVPTADVMHDGASNSNLMFASLLSNTQTEHKLSRQNDAQTAWHFPAGPGLAEEVQCPPWDYPAMSYYPSTEMPFEVMWRVWEDVDESATAAEPILIPFPLTKATLDFTVMSYNVLAQDLLELNQDLYTHCPLEVLDWNSRCSLLLEEIQKWAPDILCLQEVQENHYHEQLHPFLSQMGYTCVYKRRTGTKTDGCATCYRSSCFSEVAVTELEFFRPETELLDRHNVGIVLLLRPVITQGSEVNGKTPPLCVANTHLLFNPRRGDVKLAQLAIMLAEIDSVVKSCKVKGEHCNVILCGDFNSVPHMPLYQLITTGELYYQGLPAWMISGQEDLSYKASCYRLFAPLWPSSLQITDNCQYTTVNEKLDSRSLKSGKCQYSHDFMLQLRYCPAACVRPEYLKVIPGVTDNTPDDASKGNQPYEKRFRHTISHRLDLESVYKHILPGSGCREVTTLHSEAGDTVDYIFYSPKRSFTPDENAGAEFTSEGLKLISSLSLLSEDVLWSMHGLPNHIFPSDHLSLVAKFQLDLSTA